MLLCCRRPQRGHRHGVGEGKRPMSLSATVHTYRGDAASAGLLTMVHTVYKRPHKRGKGRTAKDSPLLMETREDSPDRRWTGLNNRRQEKSDRILLSSPCPSHSTGSMPVVHNQAPTCYCTHLDNEYRRRCLFLRYSYHRSIAAEAHSPGHGPQCLHDSLAVASSRCFPTMRRLDESESGQAIPYGEDPPQLICIPSGKPV